MATCTYCNQEMKTADGCTEGPLHLDGTPWERVPHRRVRGSRRPEGRCGDCGTLPGHLHHPGCDMEDCPRCSRQLIFACECRWDEHRDALDEDLDETGDDEPGADPFGDELGFLSRPSPIGFPAAVVPPRPTRSSRQPVPYEAATAPLRARHHDDVRALSTWALSQGRTCDRSTAAVLLEIADRERDDSGTLVLRRDDVNDIIGCRAWNLVSLAHALLPTDWMETAWTVLTWWHATERLGEASDPLPALLEPLQCAGGLDPDGRPLPEGDDVDFPCQCFLPHDPTCPPGMAALIVGRDRDTLGPLTVFARVPLRNDDPPTSTLAPLLRLFRHVEDDTLLATVPLDELQYAGRTEPDKWTPALSLYRHLPRAREGRDLLALDDEGRCWVPKADRRRRARYRWVTAHVGAALARGGVDPWSPRRGDAAWEREVDDWDLDEGDPDDGWEVEPVGAGPRLSAVPDLPGRSPTAGRG